MTDGYQPGQPARRAELAAFLRAQRARLRPADVGLPPDSVPGRRRTPGLRREEVAQLSGVGVTWYTWLEQGRNIPASAHVVDALARALLLDPDQHQQPTPATAPACSPGSRPPVRSSASSGPLPVDDPTIRGSPDSWRS